MATLMDGREPCLPGVQRTSSAISTSKFDNIGGWMGLEESPHCPFDVMEACRTGVRRDYHQPGWESSRPTTWPSPIRDRQDDSFEQQEVSGRDGYMCPATGRGGGATEEMDRNGANDGGGGQAPPEENDQGPGGQYGPFAFCAIVVLLPSMGAAAKRRWQAAAWPLVGPPQ